MWALRRAIHLRVEFKAAVAAAPPGRKRPRPAGRSRAPRVCARCDPQASRHCRCGAQQTGAVSLEQKKTEKPNAAKRVGGRRSANYATFLSAVPNVLVPRSTAPPPTLPSSACTTMVRTTAACHNTLTHARYDSHLGVCTARFLLDYVRHRRHGKRPKLGRTTRRSSQHFCTTSVGSSPGPLLLKSTRPLDFLWTMRKAALSA